MDLMWENNLIMNGCDENKFMTANKLQVIQVQASRGRGQAR